MVTNPGRWADVGPGRAETGGLLLTHPVHPLSNDPQPANKLPYTAAPPLATATHRNSAAMQPCCHIDILR
jgi:hypothetical protein